MGNKHPKLSFWFQSSLILATFILPIGVVAESDVLVAQSSQVQELPSDSQVQSEIEAEAKPFF